MGTVRDDQKKNVEDEDEDEDEDEEDMVGAASHRLRLSGITNVGGEQDTWPKWRQVLYEVTHHPICHAFIGCVLFFNIVVVVVEVDAKALHADPASWVEISNWALMAFYCTELSLRIIAMRFSFFQSKWNCFELALVSVDVLFEALSGLFGDMPSIVFLRLMRLARFFRLVRQLQDFRELFMMLHGLASAMKAIVWASLLILGMMLVWALLAVEFIHPLAVELGNREKFGECKRCQRAWSSVSMSIVTMFSSIIAGDSFGTIAIPLIEEYPFTIVFFMGSLMSMSLGMMNLIMAVIVDRAAEARKEDEVFQIQSKEKSFLKAKKKLLRMCKSLDADGSGSLSKRELTEGVSADQEFASQLKVMDIAPEDLGMVFEFLDSDGSGDIQYKEFVDQLHKLKASDSHTILVLIRHQVKTIEKMIKDQRKDTSRMLETLCQHGGHLESIFSHTSEYLAAGDGDNQVVIAQAETSEGKEPPGSKSLGIYGEIADTSQVNGFSDFEKILRSDIERLQQMVKAGFESLAASMVSTAPLVPNVPSGDSCRHAFGNVLVKDDGRGPAAYRAVDSSGSPGSGGQLSRLPLPSGMCCTPSRDPRDAISLSPQKVA